MLFRQEFMELSPESSGICTPPVQNHDQLLQEIIDDTVMKMMPDDIAFVQDEVYLIYVHHFKAFNTSL